MNGMCVYLVPSWSNIFTDFDSRTSHPCLLPEGHDGPHLCWDETNSGYVVWARESHYPVDPFAHGDEEEEEAYWESVIEDSNAEDIIHGSLSAEELLANMNDWPGLENHIKTIVGQGVGLPCS